ncbi:hypothetical protein [Tunturibacter empetritectus]|uniref:Uncharacterized protein n=1 Tax=Tunturiibacter lichenicola TaxID=2051959 RepID=A0A7W8J3V3_9BACT|nr:hypothetical protein [Edaphobacter lichenicola]MBB5342174.1 hypothetical protein [Edaphobacter lichenicola]
MPRSSIIGNGLRGAAEIDGDRRRITVARVDDGTRCANRLAELGLGGYAGDAEVRASEILI